MNIREISKEINDNAHAKGFWDKGVDVPKMIALIHSEASEALESDRTDKRANVKGFLSDMENARIQDDDPLDRPFVKNEFRRSFESTVKNSLDDELADIVIRTFDLATEMGIDLSWHIKQKVRYNATRPKMHGGKKY